MIPLGLILGWLAAIGEKPQMVRLLDVGLIGPLMLFGSRDVRAFLGAATVTYNLRNYLIQRQQQ